VAGILVAVASSAVRETAGPEPPRSDPPGAAVAPADPTAPAAATRTGELPSQDPQDGDAGLAARLRDPLERRPAFQGLPFRGDGIAINFVGADRRGRVELVLTHSGSRAAARRAYRGFLAYWRDDGRGYAVTYRRARPRGSNRGD
jgi:hypothetical protein